MNTDNPIEDDVHLIRNCTFKFKCDADWNKMIEAKGEEFELVRRCEKCNKNVYLVRNNQELVTHIEYNDCIAIPENITWLYGAINRHLIGHIEKSSVKFSIK